MSWLPAPKTLWGLVTSQESRDHVTPTLLNVNSLLEGVDFRFFWKIDMKGPYLANIGKKNYVLAQAKFFKIAKFFA